MKIEKLSRPANSIQWRRWIQEVICCEDPTFLYSRDVRLQSNSEQFIEWLLCIAKAKSAIVLCLGDTALAQTHNLAEDVSVLANMM